MTETQNMEVESDQPYHKSSDQPPYLEEDNKWEEMNKMIETDPGEIRPPTTQQRTYDGGTRHPTLTPFVMTWYTLQDAATKSLVPETSSYT